MSRKAIIVGGGKIGYYLTKTLAENDYDLSLIEENKTTSKQVANTLDATVVWGDGTCVKTLEKAGIKNCDAVIAVTGRDESNLIICQLAKKLYNIPKTIAKVNNPKNVDALKKLGVDIAISGTELIIKSLEHEVDNSRIKELIPLNEGKAAVFEVSLPEDYVYDGKELGDIRLPDGCNIISITRGEEFIIPRGKTKLMSSDVLLIVSTVNIANEVKRVLKLKK